MSAHQLVRLPRCVLFEHSTSMAFSMLRGAQHGACAQGSAPAWLPVRVPALVILPATRSARPQTTSAASSSCQVPALPARLFSATGHRAAGRRSRDVVTACLATNGTPAAGKQKLELTVAGKKVRLAFSVRGQEKLARSRGRAVSGTVQRYSAPCCEALPLPHPCHHFTGGAGDR